ncbi:MAG: lysophospholipid acyltransferase family protein [Actinomycetes bacterium]
MRRGRMGFWYRLAILVVQPLLLMFTKRDWHGRQNLPREGGLIIAINHISHLDPFTLAHFLYRGHRLPRYLAKSELWSVPFVKWVLAGAGQIPVHRRTSDAALALKDAVAAIERGECLVVYPEGTTTKDPTYWPMVPKTGVARLALTTGAPVIPMAQWGVQDIFGQERKFHLLPRKTVHVSAGPPVDLSAYAGQPLSADVLRAATDTIMTEVRRLLGELRGETPPDVAFDPKTAKLADAHTARDERRTA